MKNILQEKNGYTIMHLGTTNTIYIYIYMFGKQKVHPKHVASWWGPLHKPKCKDV